MKRLYIFLLAILAAFTANAQVTKTMTWNGRERQYLQYVPDSYQSGTSAPLMVFLHGLGDDMNNAFNTSNIAKMADEKGWIAIFPQALDYNLEIPFVGTYDFGAAWEAGVTLTVTIPYLGDMPFTLNDGVDDSGFLNEILNVVGNECAVDADSIFFAGFSLGGFMCHRMAIEHGDRINGIAAVSGLVGNDMQEKTPNANVNVLQIFGTGDQMINYDNASLEFQGYGPFVVGLNAEQSVDFWRNFNQCDAEEVFELYPDTEMDGLTFEMHSYLNGNNATRVSFLKVNDGDHYWYSGEGFDIDYVTEIYRFFTNTLDVTQVEEKVQNLALYPNPACDFVQVQLEAPALVSVYNSNGLEVLRSFSQGQLDVSGLANGLYFIKIDGKPIRAKLAVVR